MKDDIERGIAGDREHLIGGAEPFSLGRERHRRLDRLRKLKIRRPSAWIAASHCFNLI